MKKKSKIMVLVLGALFFGGVNSMAQQTDLPKGKPIITLFGDGGVGFTDGDISALGFNLERAYLGYDYGFNEHWHAKVVYDMGKGDDTKLQRIGYVKNAELDYKKGNLAVKIGLTGTSQFNFQEKFWGYRYVYKSFQDHNKWGSSADLGVSASYKFGEAFAADLSVFNGEGYKKIQSDDQLQYALGLTATPVKGLSIRAYGEVKSAKDTSSQYTAAFFAGYKCKAFRIGAEYNIQLNHGFGQNRNLQGVSIYGSGRITDQIEAFARFDYGSSHADDAWTYGQDGSTILIGMDYHNCKLFSISPNVRLTQAVDGNKMSIYACVSAKVNL